MKKNNKKEVNMDKIEITKEELDIIEANAYKKGYEDGKENPNFTMKSYESNDEDANKKTTKEMNK